MTKDKYQSIFETTPDGVIVINMKGVITEANQSALELFEYSESELIGQNINILMDHPHHAHHQGYIEAYLKSGHAKIIGIGREVDGLKKSGKKFPIRLAVGEFRQEGSIFFTGIVHDLSESKAKEDIIKKHSSTLEKKVFERTKALEREIALKEEIEKALIESQKLYETISENYPNGTITVLSNDLKVNFMAGSGLREIGFKTDRVIGESYLTLLPSVIQKTVNEHLEKVLAGEEQVFELEIDHRVYRARCVPLSRHSDKVDQILVVENNITQEKRAEIEIKSALEKERRLNEMKTNFVSMASHEFRTPLSSILSSASLIERYRETSQQPNRVKHLERIMKNVQNLNLILNDFLSVERIEGGYYTYSPERINACDFLNEVIEETSLLLQKEQKIVLKCTDTQLSVHTDSFLLRNILVNLISNASKYSNEDIEILAERKQNIVAITVRDQGIGISPEDQKQLFQRFYRASNAGNVRGTGLGLHLVKRYADLLDAGLEFTSKLNSGSSFTVNLKNLT